MLLSVGPGVQVEPTPLPMAAAHPPERWTMPCGPVAVDVGVVAASSDVPGVVWDACPIVAMGAIVAVAAAPLISACIARRPAMSSIARTVSCSQCGRRQGSSVTVSTFKSIPR